VQAEKGIIRHHHERFDGTGYPDGLKGNEIPLLARIVAVADAYDAMTTTRSYRRALPASFAMNELQRCKGSQFDPKIVDALVIAIEQELFPLPVMDQPA
jgi:HD-GYP domain-containing protein (c-di-GMP phosphodiesterase class II)